MANYLDYHPYRFEKTARQINALAEELRAGNYTEGDDTVPMEAAEFDQRMSDYNRIGWIRDRWVSAGRKILDLAGFAGTAPMAGDTEIEIPALTAGDSVYIHFGRTKGTAIGDGSLTRIDGVYLVGGEIAGKEGCYFAIVSRGDRVLAKHSMESLLREQSRVITDFAPSGAWNPNSPTLVGDPMLQNGILVADAIARAVKALELSPDLLASEAIRSVKPVPSMRN